MAGNEVELCPGRCAQAISNTVVLAVVIDINKVRGERHAPPQAGRETRLDKNEVPKGMRVRLPSHRPLWAHSSVWESASLA